MGTWVEVSVNYRCGLSAGLEMEVSLLYFRNEGIRLKIKAPNSYDRVRKAL
jgi:hypothetical protein